ncbi:unnamed protein product [Dracunculus medinensis]|uniref:Uncharacterized protein n=1 Tax=Dracunculus medinensis TaxID=318479 RepID=A0A0N4UGZ2_DRAME|nr:unnamed protein product [Dracunculus medinensis]
MLHLPSYCHIINGFYLQSFSIYLLTLLTNFFY